MERRLTGRTVGGWSAPAEEVRSVVMSDSEEECKLREDLWSSFCSVSRFQISGLLIRQASSSAVPAVRWGLACFFELAFTQGWVQGCPQHRHCCTRVPSPRTHRGARANTCSAATRQVMYLCQDQEKLKESRDGWQGTAYQHTRESWKRT